MNQVIPFSAACERNKDVILEVIKPYLCNLDSVLEIGSGTAQHAIHFARSLPNLQWQTSDQASYLDGVKAQLENSNIKNVEWPIELNVNQAVWVADGQLFDAIYTANTLHIMNSGDVRAFFTGLPSVTHKDALLIIYGPFKYAGEFTSESNREFDQSLRSRECGSAIRDIEHVHKLAALAGFDFLVDNNMPANNQCLIYKRNR